MLKMRLQRRGKTGFATYRVVVADKDAPIQGRFIADVGSYNPHTNVFAVQVEAVQTWLTQGVQPSATVHNLLVEHGLLKGPKRTIWRPPHVKQDAPPASAATAEPKVPEAAPTPDEKKAE